MSNLTLKIKKLEPDAIIPSYAHEGDAAFDLRSRQEIILQPMSRYTFSTGLSMEIPEGYYGRISDRSGLASKSGFHVLGGVVDSSYRGDVGVVLINLGREEYTVKPRDKIAQMLIVPVERVDIVEDEISETSRGKKGWGSSGN